MAVFNSLFQDRKILFQVKYRILNIQYGVTRFEFLTIALNALYQFRQWCVIAFILPFQHFFMYRHLQISHKKIRNSDPSRINTPMMTASIMLMLLHD